MIEAASAPDPVRRMLLAATHAAASPWFVLGRTSKPFDALLGETYELVTDKFRYFAECVEQEPVVMACVVSGKNCRMEKTFKPILTFKSGRVNVTDEYKSNSTLTLRNGVKETYTYVMPTLVVGNVMLPNRRYIEPQGTIFIESNSGCCAELTFMDRGMISNYYTNRIECQIYDAVGTKRYLLSGYITKELCAKDL